MYEFNKCIIEKKNGEYIAWGHVVEYESGLMRIRVKSEYNLNISNEVIILISNSIKGECKYQADVYEIDDKNIIFCNLKLLGSVQKRSNTRVNKRINYKITNVFKENEIVDLDKPIEITILNISATGIYFNCNEVLLEGFKFQLIFCETKKPIYLEVEVIRKEDFSCSFNYGCIYRNVSNKDMDEIFRFVLEEQIEQRRKNLYL
jgi:hypothetical protein